MTKVQRNPKFTLGVDYQHRYTLIIKNKINKIKQLEKQQTLRSKSTLISRLTILSDSNVQF